MQNASFTSSWKVSRYDAPHTPYRVQTDTDSSEPNKFNVYEPGISQNATSTNDEVPVSENCGAAFSL